MGGYDSKRKLTEMRHEDYGVLGGHLDFAFMSTIAVKSHMQTGNIRILAFFSNRRNPIYPEIPCSVEKGLKRTVIEVGMGLVGPRGLSPQVIKKWEDAIQVALKEPSAIQAIEKLDYVIDFKRGDDFKKEIVNDYTRSSRSCPISLERNRDEYRWSVPTLIETDHHGVGSGWIFEMVRAGRIRRFLPSGSPAEIVKEAGLKLKP
jgi:hypothetical protein